MQTSFEHKYEKGQKGFVIMRYQDQPNVMKVIHAHITGVLFQDVVAREKPHIMYLFKIETNDPKWKDDQEHPTAEDGFYLTVEEAEKGLIEAAAELRAKYEEDIAAKKTELNRLRKEQDNIIKVLPDEIPYTPQTPKSSILLPK